MEKASANGWTLLGCQVATCTCILNKSLSINRAQTGVTNSIGCEANLNSSASNLPVHVAVRSYSLLLPSDVDHINASQRVQLRLIQSDHRGGFCDCWAVTNLTIRFTASNLEATSV